MKYIVQMSYYIDKGNGFNYLCYSEVLNFVFENYDQVKSYVNSFLSKKVSDRTYSYVQLIDKHQNGMYERAENDVVHRYVYNIVECVEIQSKL